MTANQKDAALSVACAAGIAVVSAMLLSGLTAPEPATGNGGGQPIIAKVSFASGAVKRRPHRSLVWEILKLGAPAYQKDNIFVAPEASVVLTFADGSTLEPDGNTLFVVEQLEAAAPVRVDLLKGAISGAGKRGLEVRARGAKAQLSAGASGRVAFGAGDATRVDVFGGEGKIESSTGERALGPNQGSVVDGSGRIAEAAPYAVDLTAPERGFRAHYSAGSAMPGPIALAWKNADAEHRLELSGAPSFDKLLVDAAAKSGGFSFSPPGAGVYYWRVVDRARQAASETRRLMVVEDKPPTLLTPRPFEIWNSGSYPALAFSWTPVGDARGYVLEIATDPTFAQPAVSRRSEHTELWLRDSLAEGTYFWRVRADDPGAPHLPASTPFSFRVIHKPLPEAPELFKPEVDLEAAQ